ncbi:hypothetical protein AAFF_G00326000 [Aldrovandia affinis]|uniref:Uncharacterized protein n=1 Tax=Aldrovandia affinis TaxID=143900 RepID=A0AAD7T9Z0_9TELE|nr:hypothetical protein AAFF_G00326000 [Aldrovandia affinis]
MINFFFCSQLDPRNTNDPTTPTSTVVGILVGALSVGRSRKSNASVWGRPLWRRKAGRRALTLCYTWDRATVALNVPLSPTPSVSLYEDVTGSPTSSPLPCRASSEAWLYRFSLLRSLIGDD